MSIRTRPIDPPDAALPGWVLALRPTALSTELSGTLPEQAAEAFEATASEAGADPDSFALHAAAELAARFALLPQLDPVASVDALWQVRITAALYRRQHPAGAPRAAAPADPMATAGTGDHAAAHAALQAAVDARPDPRALVLALAPLALRSTAAAAHLPVLLAHVLELPAALRAASLAGLPGVGAQLASTDGWDFAAAVRARASRSGAAAMPVAAAAERVAAFIHAAPARPYTGSRFIDPSIRWVVGQVFDDDLCAAVVRIGDDQERALQWIRTVVRLGAQSMLDEPPEHARYGWTHALTLPSSAWLLARAGAAPGDAWIAAFTTFAAFRLLAVRPLPVAAAPPPGPRALAPAQRAAAAIRTDAHLVKYVARIDTLCRIDPDAGALYRAAAGRLLALWCTAVPDDAIASTLLDGRGA